MLRTASGAFATPRPKRMQGPGVWLLTSRRRGSCSASCPPVKNTAAYVSLQGGSLRNKYPDGPLLPLSPLLLPTRQTNPSQRTREAIAVISTDLSVESEEETRSGGTNRLSLARFTSFLPQGTQSSFTWVKNAWFPPQDAQSPLGYRFITRQSGIISS